MTKLDETISKFKGIPGFVQVANAFLASIRHPKRITSSHVYAWRKTGVPNWIIGFLDRF